MLISSTHDGQLCWWSHDLSGYSQGDALILPTLIVLQEFEVSVSIKLFLTSRMLLQPCLISTQTRTSITNKTEKILSCPINRISKKVLQLQM